MAEIYTTIPSGLIGLKQDVLDGKYEIAKGLLDADIKPSEVRPNTFDMHNGDILNYMTFDEYANLIRSLNPYSKNEIYFETVDLGLPSGIKWCKYNIGSKNINDPGLHFAWASTLGFSLDYLHAERSNAPTDKYNNEDGLTTLLNENDPAQFVLNSKYHTPTLNNYRELFTYTLPQLVFLDNTTISPKTKFDDLPSGIGFNWVLDGYEDSVLKGINMISQKNDNSIFLPVTNSNKVLLWTASGGSKYAECLHGYNDGMFIWGVGTLRIDYLPIRAIYY